MKKQSHKSSVLLCIAHCALCIALIILPGCRTQEYSGISMIYSSLTDVPEGGWEGHFEASSDVDLKTLDIIDNGDGTITFSIYVEFMGGGTGRLDNITVPVTQEEGGQQAMFEGDEGFPIRLSLSPKSVRVSYVDKDQNDPYCTPGATFEDRYFRR